MPASSRSIDERALTKGQLRKLNALRRSVGEDIGERAFAEWLTRQATVEAVQASDRNAELIAESLWPLVEKGKLAIRRGGYVLKARARATHRRASGEDLDAERRPDGLPARDHWIGSDPPPTPLLGRQQGGSLPSPPHRPVWPRPAGPLRRKTQWRQRICGGPRVNPGRARL